MAEHHFGTSVRVYLEWVDGRWEVDAATVDGHPLEELFSGPSAECEHDTAEDRAECRREFDAVTSTDMPNWEDLMGMLADAGCTRHGWLPGPPEPDPGDLVGVVQLPDGTWAARNDEVLRRLAADGDDGGDT